MKRAMWTLLFAAGYGGAQQSAIDAAGPQAHRIATLGWLFLGLLGTIFLIVMALTLVALLRRHRGIDQEPLEQAHRPSPQTERRLAQVVGGATGLTVILLLGLIVPSIS